MDEEKLRKDLTKIDLTPLSSYINSDEYKHYFLCPEGQEHYKLLAALSTNYTNALILDIGSLKGCSALALSYNKTNKIKSFNLINQLDLNRIPDNIEFIVDNILDQKYKSLILSSQLILLDTFHDGTFERQFHDFLLEINWKGMLILDDIKLNNEMICYWDSIKDKKLDITQYGHCTGTGIVHFV